MGIDDSAGWFQFGLIPHKAIPPALKGAPPSTSSKWGGFSAVELQLAVDDGNGDLQAEVFGFNPRDKGWERR